MSDLEKQLAGLVKVARSTARKEGRTKANPVNVFALVCVAVIAIVAIVAIGYLLWLLSSPTWCDAALGADRAVRGNNMDAARACVGLLTEQLQALAINSFIFAGGLILCLVVLIVIVVAKGEMSLSANRSGATVNIGSDVDPTKAAANQVADAADEEAADIAEHGPRPAGD